MSAGDPGSTANIQACHCQCVQGAEEMGIPLRTAIDAFYGEPTKLLLAMTKRVGEKVEEAAEAGDDFDPTTYVKGAARHRGWGKWSKENEPDPNMAQISLHGIRDEDTYNRVTLLIDKYPDAVIGHLSEVVNNIESVRDRLDRELEDDD